MKVASPKILELNPRGQVAPQVYVDNCDGTNEAEGGRWRRSRHLRRVQRPRQGGTGNDRVGFSIPCKSLFFERSFHEITSEFCSESVQKWACKKLNIVHTNRQNRADPEQLRDHVLDIQNADTVRRWLKIMSPKRPQNSANIPVKEHLRLASVVALSSSGACGAIIIFSSPRHLI